MLFGELICGTAMESSSVSGASMVDLIVSPMVVVFLSVNIALLSGGMALHKASTVSESLAGDERSPIL